jgi:hypothetical protein
MTMKKAILILLILIYNGTHAQVSSSLLIRDTRSVNDLPNFSKREIRADFKERSTIGVPGIGSYSTNLTLSPWANNENTGGKNHQLNFNDGGLFYRTSYPLDAQWGTWRQIVMENENGKVGVGTTDPVSKLSISGSLTLTSGLSNISVRPSITANTLANGEIRGYNGENSLTDDGFIRMSAGGGTNGFVKSYFELSGYSTIPDMDRNIVMGTSGNERLRIDQNGYVGIGTKTPEARLDVNGTIQINGGANGFYGFGQASTLKPIDARPASRYPYVFNWHEGLTFSAHSAYGGIRFYNQGYPDMYGTGVLVMSITNNNVGIGTTIPDSKLTVNGKIHATEVQVTQNVPADYVFEKYYLGQSSLKPDYTLLTLSEIEKFTEANHHLPNVPSAKEIKEKGLLLGEMSNALLQKVEELTLYAIDQQKTINKQTETIEKLKKENESFKKLEERLAAIEKELKTKR